MSLFAKVFSTRMLVPIACVLGGVFFMKGLGAYYDFKWATALAARLGNSSGWLSVITRHRLADCDSNCGLFVWDRAVALF